MTKDLVKRLYRRIKQRETNCELSIGIRRHLDELILMIAVDLFIIKRYNNIVIIDYLNTACISTQLNPSAIPRIRLNTKLNHFNYKT